jgi:hypothetical protein
MQMIGIVKQRDFKPDEHFVRLCSIQKQIRNLAGDVVAVTRDAFALRSNKFEDYISGACQEAFANESRDGLHEACNSILEGFSENAQQKRHTYVAYVTCADEIIEAGNQRKLSLRVRLEPKKTSAGYSAVRRLPLDNSDIELLQMLVDLPTGRIYKLS